MYDAHTHFIPPDVLNWLVENKQSVSAVFDKRDANKADFLSINGKWAFELKPSFVSEELFLREQAKAGVQHTLISPIPQLFLYEFQSEITRELVQVYNQALAAIASDKPGRLAALGTVSLNAPEQAAADLETGMDLGLKGAIIGPGHNGKLLSDAGFTPLWEAANRLKAVIFIHPLLNTDPRIQTRMMPNLVGVPWETTVAAADLLLSGLLDTYPNVKILLGHGGGFLPYQIGRLDKGYDMWNQVSSNLQAKPSEYLKRFWFDSVLWNAHALEYLVQVVGEDHIVPGSDYPFDLNELPTRILSGDGYRSLLELDR
ncbi:amidohydrolase family protein [Paenibacillus abyssi]|uniref:Amidohydrolase n=1 Tax=Paenibacillus abyssi TaxID=1340531 RepID=A0A917CWT8_9BACL|nr:amidohydrolase family protein [Paenibacillus abyssi]GGG01074.1 amidohydrolase [Paenibacillus abyssi]